ncbi:hypothetical protein [Galbibacter pacificus]|uniref:Lipoprotein n=1 Tax=Galbibacter pacificus TaxID=2996052 RepID=A0ABT6FUN0_9FLAO|nr:hypothetical protein [Galbibacter pacificus]MDG3583325.1 hypothetical protein [Galbibacter pacificus]MDG3586806.1 hypothetical protein [Galbibacter pacificus]
MKKIYNIIIGISIVFGFSKCGTSQKLIENPPFTLNEVHKEAWTTGDDKAIKGENIYITLKSGEEVMLDSIYYNSQVAKLEKVKRGTYLVYIGRFTNQQPPDIVMHADPKKEFGNKPPKLPVKPPFELKKGEALLSYTEKGKTNYYKITKMISATPIHYKESP